MIPFEGKIFQTQGEKRVYLVEDCCIVFYYNMHLFLFSGHVVKIRKFPLGGPAKNICSGEIREVLV